MTSEATPGAPKHVVILGAGPAGLAVGHEFTAQGGGQVTVVERNSYVGVALHW